MTAFTPVHSGLLQRKCACGNHASGGECAGCREEREKTLRRTAVNSEPISAVPPIVNDVLRSPGQPLDAETRAFMEPRFGFDFSQVRVHTDANAAQSASAIDSRAYAVGSHVVFAAGSYAPDTLAGKALLGHELAHVVQQRATAVSPDHHLRVGDRGDPLEGEAASYARRAMTSGAPGSVGSDSNVIRRDDPIDVELYPTPPEEAEELRRRGINLPTVSAGTYRISGGRADNAGATLVPAEEQRIDQILTRGGIAAAAPGSVIGARFLLHDTAASVGARAIATQVAQGRGPLGGGVAAWAPRAGAASIARPNFYETQRPTTTEFEKAADVITQANREPQMRAVWSATRPAERTAAITRALAGLGLTPQEITSETTTITGRLGGTGMIMTSGAWTIGEICSRVSAVGAATVANAGQDAALTTACNALASYFTTRAARVGTTVPVEIVQESGLASATGNQNACDPANPNLVPLPVPAYTDDQYRSVSLVYLRAARAAGRFPETTTHFVTDAFVRGHCDPRCFDLQRFYNEIAARLGHGAGSTYGPAPNYGVTWGTHNIWWNDRICGGAHP
jgi:Domain of unknown function (DUF4157)